MRQTQECALFWPLCYTERAIDRHPRSPLQPKVKPLGEFSCTPHALIGPDLELDVLRVFDADDLDGTRVKLGRNGQLGRGVGRNHGDCRLSDNW